MKKMMTAVMATVVLAAVLGCAEEPPKTEITAETPPKMKMTTEIPPEITTPDKVETRLGTLNFKNGMPDQTTIDKVYDNIDFARAVEVYLNTQSGVSLWGFRKGMRAAGVPDHVPGGLVNALFPVVERAGIG